MKTWQSLIEQITFKELLEDSRLVKQQPKSQMFGGNGNGEIYPQRTIIYPGDPFSGVTFPSKELALPRLLKRLKRLIS